MNRIIALFILVGAILVGGVAIGTVVSAEDTPPMTEEHIARIRANCVDAQSILSQLHASDAGLRVNRGQIYESIATKLMAPFNSRLVFNRINEASLLASASEYEKQLQLFRTQYQQYEEAMSATLRIDCVNQPVAFYDSVVDTRKKRQLTHQSAVDLQSIIKKYGTDVETFAKNFQAEKS
jgi:hypothetical protein